MCLLKFCESCDFDFIVKLILTWSYDLKLYMNVLMYVCVSVSDYEYKGTQVFLRGVFVIMFFSLFINIIGMIYISD